MSVITESEIKIFSLDELQRIDYSYVTLMSGEVRVKV